MAKDIQYFIREAKDQIRKEINLIDIGGIIDEASLQRLSDLGKAIREDSNLNMGYELGLIITEYIESQGEKINTLAAQMLIDYQEDCKAEADEARHSAKHGG